jgi:epoxyqueuosine reductase
LIIDALNREVENRGDRMAIVPVGRLAEIRQDLEELKDRYELNQFQHFVLDKLYSLDLPEAGLEARSILVIATPSPAAAPLRLHWNGKPITTRLPASYMDKSRTPLRVGGYLNEFLAPRGYQASHAPKLPHKRLAVRSGLARYGKNNISYVESMGSYLNLALFFSDLPCVEDTWQEARMLEQCQDCRICLQNCPTGAILPERFLIDNMRCLTYFNEGDSRWDFPAWIDPAAHHTLYGCLRCQNVCPANKPYGNSSLEPVEFDEDETGCLLAGKPFESLPAGLQHKVAALDMKEYLAALPRNIRALLR